MHTFLDLLQLLSVAGFGLAVGLLSVGIWNVYLGRLVQEAQEGRERETFIQALRRTVLTRVSTFNARTFSRKYQARIDQSLTYAGNPGELTPPEFIGLQEVAFVGF